MADAAATAQLANAITALATCLQAAPTAAAPTAAAPAAAGSSAPVHDLCKNDDPFDLGTRTGLSAHNTACEPLDATWDGDVQTFPDFLRALEDRATDCNWNSAGPGGISKIGTKDIFAACHDIKETDVETACTGRTNERAKQNSRAMHRAIKKSISGDVKTTVFETIANRPTNIDGPEMFIKITKLTTLSTIQMSIRAMNDLMSYDPSDADCCIPTINKQVNKLFVLAATGKRKLDDTERVSLLLGICDRIKQPHAWHSWAQRQQDDFDQGKLTVANDFMSSAVIHHNKVKNQHPDKLFKGSLNTLQDDIAAMVTKAAAGKAAAGKRKKEEDDEALPAGKEKQHPPFIEHCKLSKDAGAKNHVVGDTKQWNNKTWHFCDCPNHKHNAHWHLFPAAECRTRSRWIEQEKKKGNDPTANNGNVTEDPSDERAPSSIDATDAPALLAAALAAIGDRGKGVPQAIIANAMEAVNDL